MCRLRNIALESVTEVCDRQMDGQTDDGQSDPYVSQATQKCNMIRKIVYFKKMNTSL